MTVPPLSIWLIRSALLHLGFGFTTGALLLGTRGLPGATAVGRLLPLHMEILLFGWLVQLTMGVAYWLLPRYRSGAERGPPVRGWLAYGFWNAGVLLAGVALAAGFPPGVVLAGRASEAFGAVCYVGALWGRIKPFGAD